MLMFFKSLRGFRKLFTDHIGKRSKREVEDKTGCEHFPTCVFGLRSFPMLFPRLSFSCSSLLRLSLAQHGKYGTYCTCHPGVSQPSSAGKLQRLTSKSKVHRQNQTVSCMPNKNHWTPHSCDEEKQLRLQSQHNFLPFHRNRAHSQVLPLCCS